MTPKKSKKARKPLTAESATAPTPTPRPTPAPSPASSTALAPPPAPAAAKPPLSLPLLGPTRGSAPWEPRARNTRWLVLGAILAAWVLGFGARAVWLAKNEDTPQAMYKDKRLLTTADAYYYASGVQHEVGDTLPLNTRVPGSDDNIIVLVASTLVGMGLPIEDVTLWMPAFMAPLVAVPLVLLGLLFGQILWGFLASLIAVLGFSYWNRTVVGYFDTDMVTITYVVGVAALVAAAFWRKRPLFATIAAWLIVAAPYMHPGSERVLAALALGSFGYAIVFERKEPAAYRIAIAVLIAFLPIPVWLRLGLIGGLELLFWRVRVPLWSLVALATLVLGFVLWRSRAMDLVLGAAGIKMGGGGGGARWTRQQIGVHFPGIGETVAELANPALDKLGERIAGTAMLVVTGAIGYFAACWRFRPMLMFMPLFALGTVLAASGQRYTIFAVPVFALGNVWLMLLIGRQLAAWFTPTRPRVAAAIATLLLPVALLPALHHALGYPARTALSNQEAAQLAAFRPDVKPGDFVITWWDYSYGLWYYAGANTIIDGSKQNNDLWIAAEVLFTSSQREAASLMRLAAEEQALQSENPFDTIVDNIIGKWKDQTGLSTKEFLPSLREGRTKLPTPTRQVFFYLPWRLMQIAPNVAKLRPARGLLSDTELKLKPFLVVAYTNPDGTPTKNPGWRYDADARQLVGGNGERIDVWRVTDVQTDAGSRVRSSDDVLDPDGNACVVNLRHSRMVVYADRATCESVMAQLLFYARPDRTLFQPMQFGPAGVIYKVLL